MIWPTSRRAAASSLLAAVLVTLVSAFHSTPVAASPANPGTSAGCTARQLSPKVVDGQAGAGNVSWLLQVRNVGPTQCDLSGYPEIIRSNGATSSPAVEAQAPIPIIGLHKGETSSSLVGGTDMPIGVNPTCPTGTNTIRLPGQGNVALTDHKIQSCGWLVVHPFVVGFNGLSATGELLGTAPTCARNKDAASPIGPIVQIDAWSGTTLSGSVGVFASPTAKSPFQMVLMPGRYRIHSEGAASSVRVTVRAGYSTQLGRFGTCTQPPGIPSTIPGRSGPSPTTTTTTA